MSRKRLDIQVLRGVAVLGVMLAHFNSVLPAGFLGVDIFFAISGFVITLSLIRLRKEKIPIAKFLNTFWRRRFFRLVPVLVVVIAATLIAASLFLSPDQFGPQVKMSVWALFFAGNVGVVFQSGSGDYFDRGVDQNWLLHLWSLGVEEQFYLVFPFLFLMLVPISRLQFQLLRSALVIIFLLLFSFSLSLLNYADVALGWGGIFAENLWSEAFLGYYSPLTRAWQFLVGVLAAFIVVSRKISESKWLPMFGVGLLILSFAITAPSNLLPGFPTALPMLAVFILLTFPLSHRVAESPVFAPLVWLGNRSYSAYLWHWPVWLVTSKIMGPTLASGVLSFLVTLTLSALSYRLIELPFIQRGRAHGTRSTTVRTNPVNIPKSPAQVRTPVAPVAIGIASLLIACFALIGFDGRLLNPTYQQVWLSLQHPDVVAAFELVAQRQNSPESRNFGADSEGNQVFSGCHFRVKEISEAVAEQLLKCRDQYGAGTLVLGDSHAIDLFGVISSRFDTGFLIGVSQGACTPHTNKPSCQYSGVTDFLQGNTDVFQLVIFEQAGFYLLREDEKTPGSRAMFHNLGPKEPVEGLLVDEQNVQLTADYLDHLSQYTPVLWFLPRPDPHIPDTQIIEGGCRYEFSYRPGQKEVFDLLDRYIEMHVQARGNRHFTTLSQSATFNFRFPEDFMTCDAIYWADGDHFSSSGEEKFGDRLPEGFVSWQGPAKK